MKTGSGIHMWDLQMKEFFRLLYVGVIGTIPSSEPHTDLTFSGLMSTPSFTTPLFV